MSDKDTTDYILRKVPNDLWDNVKHKAIDEGLTIRQYLLNLLERETRSWQQKKTETER